MTQQVEPLGCITRLQVNSETGRLRQVILHDPGKEIELMTPSNHNALLFEDILLLERACEEHNTFRELLKKLDVQILLLEELLTQALPVDRGDSINWGNELREEDRKRWDIEFVIHEVVQLHKRTLDERGDCRWLGTYFDALQENLRRAWLEQGPEVLKRSKGLARVLIQGFVAKESMANFFDDVDPFLLTPIPNILFMRDPAAVVRDNIIVSSMAKPARRREALVMSLIFQGLRHMQSGQDKRLFDGQFWFDPFSREEDRRDEKWIKVEGGDVLVIHDRILALGLSERTTREMLHRIAQRLINDNQIAYAVLMPQQRSTMHLDTVFTMVSENECLIYPPMIVSGGIEQARVVRLTKKTNEEVEIKFKPSLISALEVDLRQLTGKSNFHLTPIFCGGQSLIDQDREQWCDGANVLALAPGVIIGYDRNYRTFEALSEHGYEVVRAQDILTDQKLASNILAEMNASIPEEEGYRSCRQKYAITLPSAELSRARGGPRCMTMPLFRKTVEW